jgi:LysR family transcriptional regulator, glycine cleavage system transcriptional activator
MPLRLPPLSGLRLFEAAARCGSFKAAAHELGLTPSAFTHAIDSLEQWLDVQLFERDARGVVLTAAGRKYLPYISEALSMIATGTLRLPSRRFQDRLSITSADLFAYRVLLPRLHKFREMHPNMVVTVDVNRQIVALPSDQFDIAIRSGPDSWPGLSCDLLGRVKFAPVGAPQYVHNLLRDGTIDWSRATLIHNVNVSEDWETWCNHTRIDTSAAQKLVVSTAQLAFEAAVGGLGLAIGRLPLIDNDIAAGQLVIAVDHVVPVATAYWLVRPAGAETRPEIIAFTDWLLKEMSQLKWNGHSEGRAASRSA